MALGLTRPLTEMCTSNISWVIRLPVHKTDNLTTLMCQLSLIWEPQPPVTLRACTGITLLFIVLRCHISLHHSSTLLQLFYDKKEVGCMICMRI